MKQSTLKKPMRLGLVGVVTIGLVLLVLATAFVLRFAGAKWRNDELLAITASGAPSLPEDLQRPADPRPEPTQWLAQATAARTRWDPVALTDAAMFGALREKSAQGQFGGEAEEAFAALETCAGSSANAAAAVQRVLDILNSHDGIVVTPPCGLEAVRLTAMGMAAHGEVGMLAGRYGPIDPQVIVDSLTATGATFPTLPIQSTIDVGASLQLELLQALWSERLDRVPDLLRAQRDVAHIYEGAPFLVGAFGVFDSERSLLGMIELALPRLDPGTDLAWLERDLEAMRPRAQLATAATGERAFGNRAFELIRHGGDRSELPANSFLPASLRISYDQAYFLDTWGQRIASLDDAAFRRASPPRPGWFDRVMAPISSALATAPDAITALADELEARLVLARTALLAFRTDAKALLEFIPKTSDPFDGKPIRCGFNDGGLVILWSVGPDGVDDGGTDDAKDIVWRYKPR